MVSAYKSCYCCFVGEKAEKVEAKKESKRRRKSKKKTKKKMDAQTIVQAEPKLNIDPPGYEFDVSDDDYELPKQVQEMAKREKKDDKMILRLKVWELGKSPASNILSTLLMMYFSGNILSLMSLMLVGLMLSGPIKSLLNFKRNFEPFDKHLNKEMIVVKSKLLYILINLAILGTAIYKINKMGLLPFSDDDMARSWPAFTPSEMGGEFVII